MNVISRLAAREATFDKAGRGKLTRAGMFLGSVIAIAFPSAMISGLDAQNDAVTKGPAAFAEALERQLPDGMVMIGSEGAGSPNSTSGLIDSKATTDLPKVSFGLPTGSDPGGKKVDYFTTQFPGSGTEPDEACPKGGAVVSQGIETIRPGQIITVNGIAVCVGRVDNDGGYVGRVGAELPLGVEAGGAMTVNLVPEEQAATKIESHLKETGQQAEIITPQLIQERTERLWKDSSDSLFGLTKTLGSLAGLLVVGGFSGFRANSRRRKHNDLSLAGATKKQIFGLEYKIALMSLVPGAVLGSGLLSRGIIDAANKQTLNLGAKLNLDNFVAGLTPTVAVGALVTSAAALISARKANPRGDT
jgi:hypothetical protein